MRFLRRRRRRAAESRSLTVQHRAVVSRNLVVYGDLEAADRRELEGRIHVLLDEKVFEGCGGMDLTDEHRVTVAAYGALLLLHRDTDYYPRLGSILVYPSAFLAPVRHAVGDTAAIETDEERVGESWAAGSMVVSWEDALADIDDPAAGCNVVIHEFAHQLDEEESQGEGLPVLASARAYRTWQAVFSREYEAHCDAVGRGRPTLIDEYGAESPAEFFAVATETFFLLPVDLRMRHPDLYRELAGYYRQDPARWGRSAPS
jgi:Mlc titration factor MtfA (ptsG expression regulator)